MYPLAHWDGWFWPWTGSLWFLLPLMMIFFCVIGMFLCGRMCCGRGWMPWGHDERPGEGNTPLDIAKRRYAQGEISKEQYEDIKQTLG